MNHQWTRCRYGLLFATAAIFLAACGESSEGTDQFTGQDLPGPSSVSTTIEATEQLGTSTTFSDTTMETAPPENPYFHTRSLHVVHRDGWEYDLTIDFEFYAEFYKYIAHSPPGKSRWETYVDGFFSYTATPTLEGRQAPELQVVDLYAGYTIPVRFSHTVVGLSSTENCGLGSSFFSVASLGEPNPDLTVLTCQLRPPGFSTSNRDNEEADIDELIDSLGTRKPEAFTIHLRAGGMGLGCYVIIPADQHKPVSLSGVGEGNCTAEDME